MLTLKWHVVMAADAGTVLFVSGMTINIHSDDVLRSLRCRVDDCQTLYQIPQGV